MTKLKYLSLLTVIGVFVCAAAADGVLLIPDSGNDNVWAFDPYDGHLISDNFIPSDGRFVTPLTPVDSGYNSILISDQSADAVFEYGYDGVYIRTIADSSNGLDNVRGLTVYNDQIYVCVDSGANPDTVQRFNMDGSGQTTFASGLSSPWFVQFRENDVLVSDSGTENIERFDMAGNMLSPFHDSDGVSGIDFPQQMFQRANGNILAAGFSSPAGIYEYDSFGTQLNYYDASLSLRGVWELGNGKLLHTGGTIVGTYDPTNGEIVDIVNNTGSSFRHIGFTPLPEPTALVLILVGAAIGLRKR